MMEMEDYTDYLLSGQCVAPDNEELEQEADVVGLITLSMLRKRPDIRSAIIDAVGELLPATSTESDPEVLNEQIIRLIKSDPFVEGTIYECIIGATDMLDDEGEEMYIPSIFATDDAQELISQADDIGFREDYDPIPAKYFHLSPENLDRIYKHPEARKMLSKLPADVITDDFVESLCK